MYPSFKTYLHTVSAPVCFAASECSGIRLLYCMPEVNACKSQVHKRCLSINLSLQFTFHKLHLSFLLLVMMMMMMNCFCGMVDRPKAFGLISTRDHC